MDALRGAAREQLPDVFLAIVFAERFGYTEEEFYGLSEEFVAAAVERMRAENELRDRENEKARVGF